MLRAVQAVQLVQDALKRKPEWLEPITFYASTDEWLYIESGHPNMCAECHSYNMNVYFGNSLRAEFPYHKIRDENTIAALVHPYCECTLIRLFPVII